MENADGESSFLLSFKCKCRVVEMIRVLLLNSKKIHWGVYEGIQLFERLRECRCMSESVGSMVCLYESLCHFIRVVCVTSAEARLEESQLRLYEVAATMVSGQSGKIVDVCECGQFH